MRTCELHQCHARHKALGLCQRHYNQARRQDRARPRCRYCTRPSWAKGLCDRHYRQAREHRLPEAS